LNGATAGGTVVTDAEGHNDLWIESVGAPTRFARVPDSDNLYILLNGGETYDRARDVVWVDFFGNPDNEVNGLTAAVVGDLAGVVGDLAAAPRPLALAPPPPDFA
jgi:hypothetical protein